MSLLPWILNIPRQLYPAFPEFYAFKTSAKLQPSLSVPMASLIALTSTVVLWSNLLKLIDFRVEFLKIDFLMVNFRIIFGSLLKITIIPYFGAWVFHCIKKMFCLVVIKPNPDKNPAKVVTG